MFNDELTTEKPTLSLFDTAYAIEAILFAAGHSVTRDKLCKTVGCDEKMLDDCEQMLSEKYNKNGGGICFLKLSDSYQLCTNEKYGEYVKEALDAQKGGNLSRASLEVLAIIAYNEPVTRSYIDSVRGVDCSYTVTSLSEKGLIEPCGQLDAPGKPTLWKTTTEFLRIFGISSVQDLPPIELADGLGQVIIKPWGVSNA